MIVRWLTVAVSLSLCEGSTSLTFRRHGVKTVIAGSVSAGGMPAARNDDPDDRERSWKRATLRPAALLTMERRVPAGSVPAASGFPTDLFGRFANRPAVVAQSIEIER